MLHRSVTEMRRLRRGRPKTSRIQWADGRTGGGVAGRIDPDLGSVSAEFLLPHGQAGIYFLHNVTTDLASLCPGGPGGAQGNVRRAPGPPATLVPRRSTLRRAARPP